MVDTNLDEKRENRGGILSVANRLTSIVVPRRRYHNNSNDTIKSSLLLPRELHAPQKDYKCLPHTFSFKRDDIPARCRRLIKQMHLMVL